MKDFSIDLIRETLNRTRSIDETARILGSQNGNLSKYYQINLWKKKIIEAIKSGEIVF